MTIKRLDRLDGGLQESRHRNQLRRMLEAINWNGGGVALTDGTYIKRDWLKFMNVRHKVVRIGCLKASH